MMCIYDWSNSEIRGNCEVSRRFKCRIWNPDLIAILGNIYFNLKIHHNRGVTQLRGDFEASDNRGGGTGLSGLFWASNKFQIYCSVSGSFFGEIQSCTCGSHF